MGLWKRCWLCLVLLLAGAGAAYGWGSKPKFPAVDLFLTPPYQQVEVGNAPGSLDLPKRLPELNPGEFVLYYLNERGEASALQAASPYRFPVVQPAADRILSVELSKANVALSATENMLTTRSLAGGISLSTAALDLTTTSAGGGVQAEVGERTLAKQQARGAIRSSAMERTGDTTSSGSGLSMSSDTLDTEETADRGGENSVRATKEVTGAAVTGKGMFSRMIAQLLDKLNMVGKHGSLIDFDMLLAEIGENYLAIINELVSTLGITDERYLQTIIDERYIPTVDELDAFTTLVYQDAAMKDLLHRPFSKRFLGDALATGTRPEVQVSFAALPEPLYHGHLTGLLLTIKNTGEVPLYDSLVVMAMPEHTEYSNYLDEQPMQRGYFNLYLPGRRYAIMKIYRPLAPGETFRNIVFLNLEPWELDQVPQA